MSYYQPSNSIFVGNLDIRVKADDIIPIFKNIADVDSVKVVKKVTYAYAFVAFSNVTSVDSIIEILRLSGTRLYQRKLRFQTVNKKKCDEHVKPSESNPIFELLFNTKTDTSDELLQCQSFDIDPEDSDRPSVHILVDDVLLKIFSYLSLKDVLQCAIVCRRFESIISTILIEKLGDYQNKGGCFTDWLEDNDLLVLGCNFYIQGRFNGDALRLLRNCGHTLKTIVLKEYSNKYFYAIGRLCPNLEELSIVVPSCTYLDDDMKTGIRYLAGRCKKLRKLCLKGQEINSGTMTFLFTNFKSLESFVAYAELNITHSALTLLPKSLKEFCSYGGINGKLSWICFFHKYQKLEMFKLSTTISEDALRNAAKYCPNIKELRLHFDNKQDIFQWSIFPKLTKLSISAYKIDLNSMAECEHLEELHIRNDTFSTTVLITDDFSSLKNLRRLHLNVFPMPSNSALEKISGCQKLEYLHCNIKRENLAPILLCIERLPLLAELVCKNIQLSLPDIKLLYKVGKKNKKPINLTVSLPSDISSSELDCLTEANYCINLAECRFLASTSSLHKHLMELAY